MRFEEALTGWRAGENLNDYLCERFERTVGRDNCVHFEALCPQIPADTHCHHHVKAKVQVLRPLDGTLSLFHGPGRSARYPADGQLMTAKALPEAA